MTVTSLRMITKSRL